MFGDKSQAEKSHPFIPYETGCFCDEFWRLSSEVSVPGSHLCRKHLSGGSSPVVGQGDALPAVNTCVCGAAHQHLGEVDDCIRAKHFTQGPILS